MPRLSRQATSDFFAATTAARDTGDVSAFGEYVAANWDRLPAWARQEADRVVNNLRAAEQVRASGEIESAGPPGTVTVMSLVPVLRPGEGGIQVPGYATVKTILEPGEGIDKVLQDINTLTDEWEKDQTGVVRTGGPLGAPSAIVAWQVYGPETPSPNFPLGS